jgi:hypothetical protein
VPKSIKNNKKYMYFNFFPLIRFKIIFGLKFLVGKMLYKFYMGYDPDPALDDLT